MAKFVKNPKNISAEEAMAMMEEEKAFMMNEEAARIKREEDKCWEEYNAEKAAHEADMAASLEAYMSAPVYPEEEIIPEHIVSTVAPVEMEDSDSEEDEGYQKRPEHARCATRRKNDRVAKRAMHETAEVMKANYDKLAAEDEQNMSFCKKRGGAWMLDPASRTLKADKFIGREQKVNKGKKKTEGVEPAVVKPETKTASDDATSKTKRTKPKTVKRNQGRAKCRRK